MPKPPLTRKFIPAKVKTWNKEMRGFWKYINSLQGMEKDYGTKWVVKQREYAELRLADLVDNRPRLGIVPKAIKQWREEQKWPLP